jgi:hypothetical protein
MLGAYERIGDHEATQARLEHSARAIRAALAFFFIPFVQGISDITAKFLSTVSLISQPIHPF